MPVINNEEREPMLLGLKLMHIFSMGCVGSAQVYLPAFYNKVLGLGTDKVGFLYSITPFVSCFAFPLWTSWADKTGKHKQIMITNMLIALAFVMLNSLLVCVTRNGVKVALASVCCFGYAFFGYPVIGTMVDSVTLRVLGNNRKKKQLYGRQKLGAPIGIGVSVFLTGLLTDLCGPFALFGVFASSVLGFIITCLLTNLASSPSTQQASSSSSWRAFLSQPNAKRLLVVMALLGIIMNVMFAFLVLFIEKDLHGSPALTGLLGPLASGTEIVCFFFAKEIFQWLGPRRMLIGTHIILICRCLIYIIALFCSNALLATMIQPLHGIAFSFLWSAAVVQADEIAPEGFKGRAQGLLGTMYLGFGAGTGTLLCGYVYESYGANVTWCLLLVLTLIGLLVYTAPPPAQHGYTVIPDDDDKD